MHAHPGAHGTPAQIPGMPGKTPLSFEQSGPPSSAEASPPSGGTQLVA